MTGTYDPETNLTFWGTGNAAPWFGDQRPGDNLYTTSVVALDVDTGKIKGHHQYHQNDSWDWDEVSPPIAGRLPARRAHREGPGHTSRAAATSGRSSAPPDKINFVAGQPYVRQNVFKSLDPKTGRPEIDETKQARHRQDRRVLPEPVGRQGLAAGRLQPADAADVHPRQREPVQPSSPATRRSTFPASGSWASRRHRHEDASPAPTTSASCRPGTSTPARRSGRTTCRRFIWGPVLATAGDLLFAGGTNDRMFRAFDAKTGKILWEYPDHLGRRRASRSRSRSTASSTSRCSPAGASTQRRCSRG